MNLSLAKVFKPNAHLVVQFVFGSPSLGHEFGPSTLPFVVIGFGRGRISISWSASLPSRGKVLQSKTPRRLWKRCDQSSILAISKALTATAASPALAQRIPPRQRRA